MLNFFFFIKFIKDGRAHGAFTIATQSQPGIVSSHIITRRVYSTVTYFESSRDNITHFVL